MQSLAHHIPKNCPNCALSLDGFQDVLASQTLLFCMQCQFPLFIIAGKYRIKRKLSQGGFGVVYLCQHLHLRSDELRAVKLFPQEQVRSLSYSRFYREVQVTASLSQRNDHIIRIYDDFGSIPNVGYFYIMEYLEGQTLTDWLRQNPFPSLPDCLHVMTQLCEAMKAAHGMSIVHRDLKPDNLFQISHKDDPLFLKILDFGIAKTSTLD